MGKTAKNLQKGGLFLAAFLLCLLAVPMKAKALTPNLIEISGFTFPEPDFRE